MSKKHDNEKSSKKQNKWQQIAEKSSAVADEQSQQDEVTEITENLEEQAMDDKVGIDFPSRQELEDQLTAMERKVDEFKEKALRVQADMENVRRRTERDVSNAHKYGIEKLVIDLLPVMDSLVRGLEAPESKDSHIKSMREGIELTLGLLQSALEKHGVEVVDPKQGDAFNPEIHEAMSLQHAEGAQSNTIITVVQKGYTLNGRVVRAAMVIVAR